MAVWPYLVAPSIKVRWSFANSLGFLARKNKDAYSSVEVVDFPLVLEVA